MNYFKIDEEYELKYNGFAPEFEGRITTNMDTESILRYTLTRVIYPKILPRS